MIVQVRYNHLYYFRKKALRSEVEIYAMLFGTRISPSIVDILSFQYPKVEAATYNSFKADKTSYNDLLAWGTTTQGWSFIGDLHSHPREDPAPSRADIKNHRCNHLMISGVVGIIGEVDIVQFWEACSPVPCTIKYVK